MGVHGAFRSKSAVGASISAGGKRFLRRSGVGRDVDSEMSRPVREPCDGGAEMAFRRVPELLYEGMALEGLLHDAALHAPASSVDQPHFAETPFPRSGHVLVDDGGDVFGGEGVEVEGVFDRNSTCHGGP